MKRSQFLLSLAAIAVAPTIILREEKLGGSGLIPQIAKAERSTFIWTDKVLEALPGSIVMDENGLCLYCSERAKDKVKLMFLNSEDWLTKVPGNQFMVFAQR